MKKKYRFCKTQKKGNEFIEFVKAAHQKVKIAVMTFAAYLFVSVPVFASTPDYTNLKLFSGTKNLIAAGTGALTVLIGAITTFYTVKGIQEMQVAQDEEKPKKKKAIITTLVLGVLGTCASGIVTWVLAFYA